MLSNWIVASYRALVELALWGALIAGAVVGGAAGFVVDHGYLGTALGAVGGFMISSVLLGAALMLTDVHHSLKRVRDDAMNRVPTVAPGFTVSTGAAIAKAVADAREATATADRAYEIPPTTSAPGALPPEPMPQVVHTPDPMPPAPLTFAPAAPAPTVVGAVVGLGMLLIFGGYFLFLRGDRAEHQLADQNDDRWTEEEAAYQGRQDSANAPPEATPTGPGIAEALASIRADPTAQVPQETTTDAEGGASTSEDSGVLNPLWHGTWAIQNPDSPYGLQRVEIDASGFNFHLQAHQSDVSTQFVPWREAGDKRQMPDGYMTYTDERVTRDDLVSRYETALRIHPRQSITPPDAARRVLGALRPGRYKVVARLMRYDDACGDRYVLDDDVLVEFSECEGFWLKQLARQ